MKPGRTGAAATSCTIRIHEQQRRKEQEAEDVGTPTLQLVPVGTLTSRAKRLDPCAVANITPN
jgi:hypothetical protein